MAEEEEEVVVILEAIQEVVKEVVEQDMARLGKMDITQEAPITQEDEKSYNLFFVFIKRVFFIALCLIYNQLI